MNHNFLPFEVTELLPKENPYNNGFIYANAKEGIQLLHYCNLQYGESVNRDAWTIIDALIWLEEQGYYLLVNYSQKQEINKWSYTFVSSGQVRSFVTNKYYNSRIEAYIAGIKHCLNLIKNEIPT